MSWLNLTFGILVVVAHFVYLQGLETDFNDKYFGQKGNNVVVKDYVVVWIPIFFGTIFLEILFGIIQKKKLYRLSDSLSSLGCGSLMTLSSKLFTQTVFSIGMYNIVWKTYGETIHREYLPQWVQDSSALQWWTMFVGVEFFYYWVHRTGHTVNAFWAMHGVHHSSEEYNLSTALRQSSIHGFFSSIYYLPLALFFPHNLFAIHNQINTLFQYWIHTQVIGKLGPLEYILNTPSQHRVHHGRNSYCIDKNYGGTLCIFDRLFGTFQEELDTIPVVYGLTHSLNTFNPVSANVNPWKAIFRSMSTTKGFSNKFRILWDGPGYIAGSHPPAYYPIPPCTTDSQQKYDPRLSSSLKLLVTLEFVMLMVSLENSLRTVSHLETFSPSYWITIASFLWAALGLYCIGCICDRSPSSLITQIVFSFCGITIQLLDLTLVTKSFDHQNAAVVVKLVQVGILVVCTLIALLNRSEFSKAIGDDEIGKDHPFSAEAEARQLKQHEEITKSLLHKKTH